MSIVLKHNDILKCPHCSKELFYPVHEYYMPHSKNEHECGSCNKSFNIELSWDIGMKVIWEYTIRKKD